jgi:hypothetical protein
MGWEEEEKFRETVVRLVKVTPVWRSEEPDMAVLCRRATLRPDGGPAQQQLQSTARNRDHCGGRYGPFYLLAQKLVLCNSELDTPTQTH